MGASVGSKHFHGLEIELRALSGARAVRVVHPCGQAIDEHVHGCPSLTLPLIGGCIELYDGGEARVAGPSAVLHPAGAPHADRIEEGGMETVSLQFDPAWLGMPHLRFMLDRTRCWTGGSVGAAAGRLSAAWTDPAMSEGELRAATVDFLERALREGPAPRPAWIDAVVRAVECEEPAGTDAIAHALDLNPAWLARAYRSAMGEGIQETRRRKRVERTTALLRSTELSPAEIAVAAGFCDQSHMNRCVRAVIGRTPVEVRNEQPRLAELRPAA